MNIDLTKPQELPSEFLERLRSIDALCEECEYSEALVEKGVVSSIVKDINEYCLNNKVVGIHYTRAIPEDIRSRGLLVRDGESIRNTFLTEHGHLFSSEEIAMIKGRWNSYFYERQCEARDRRIFFNFTEAELGRSGTKYLLGLYGGEQVSMCFDFDDPIGEKLTTIGQPLVVKCSLDPNQLNTFIEHPWGKIAVSAYHVMVNPSAYCIDQDGYQSAPVFPSEILEVRALTRPSI